jgi:hypothetical protein
MFAPEATIASTIDAAVGVRVFVTLASVAANARPAVPAAAPANRESLPAATPLVVFKIAENVSPDL